MKTAAVTITITTSVNASGHEMRPVSDFVIGRWTLRSLALDGQFSLPDVTVAIARGRQRWTFAQSDRSIESDLTSTKKYRPPRPMDAKGGCSPQNIRRKLRC